MKEKKKDQEEHQKKLEEKSDKVKGGKKYSDILSRVIHEGEELFKVKSKAIFLSAILARLEIGFSYFMVCTLYYLLQDSVDQNILIKSFGFVYPVGFILVILGKSALFTEQTPLLALPVLNGQRSLLEMLRIWGLVITGNVLVGHYAPATMGDFLNLTHLTEKYEGDNISHDYTQPFSRITIRLSILSVKTSPR